MIELGDPRWEKLSHAYGSAADIPELLRQLAGATGPKIRYDSEPWFTLWSSLCHQGDVYDASYAALPHLTVVYVRRAVGRKISGFSYVRFRIVGLQFGRSTLGVS